jgi:apolipoprotein N-acyltransferase
MDAAQTAGSTVFGLDRAGRPIWRLVALTIIAAAALALAFPPFDITALAWVALVPLFLACSQARPKQGFVLGLVFGVLFMGYVGSFAGQYGLLPWAALSIFMGIFYALFGLIASAFAPLHEPPLRVLAFGGAWVLLELVRGSFGPFAYTFGQIAYTQYDMLPMLQVTSITGSYGLGFLMAVTAAAMACLLQAFLPPGRWYYPPGSHREFTRTSGRTMLAVWVAMFITYLWGGMVIGQSPDEVKEGLPVAVVQGNVSIKPSEDGQSAPELLDLYATETEALNDDVRLVVWPETAVPAFINQQPMVEKRIGDIAIKLDTYMLVGALEKINERIYNSAYLFTPDGEIAEIYRKMDLVMFGEWVPYRDTLPFVDRYPIREWDFSPGKERTTMQVDGLKLSPIICFEGIFPRASREVTRLDAEAIAVLNSDAWADRSPEILYNSHTAPLRAAESRRFLIRAASTGISGIYDPYGRPAATVAANEAGTAEAVIRPRDTLSTYHKWGDAPVIVISLLGLIMAAFNLPARRLAEAAPPVP